MREVTPHRRHGALLLVLLLAAALGSCSEPNTLEGSLGEVVDLSFEDVEVSVTETAVIVGYTRKKGHAREVVFKLVVDVVPENVQPGMELDLSPGPEGEPRAVAGRSVGEESIRTFAAIRRGYLVLDAKPVVNEPCSGEFRVTLGEGGDAGEGRAAFGRFAVDWVVHGE